MGYDYNEEFLTKRASSGGKDPGRKRTADQLYAQATQPPHEDDAAALSKLADFSGVSHPGEMGWATADARNYGKMLLGKANSGYTPEYDKAHDGSFNLGHALGSVLKVAAPLAGAFIPGLGTLGAMAVGGLGSAAGGALHGDKFDLGKTLMAGGAAAAGNKLLGNGLGGTIPSAPTDMISAPGVPGASGGAPDAVAGAIESTRGAVPGMTAPGGAPGGDILGQLGNFIKKDPGKAIGTATGLMGFMDARKQQHSAADFNNAQLDLRKRQLSMAENDYNSRSGLRNQVFSRLGSMASGQGQPVMNSSIYGRR